MEKTKSIISANKDSHTEFNYYFSVIKIAEESINEKPDVTIDCCKSLIEGISKSILISLDNNYSNNNKLVDGVKALKLFNKAIKIISKYDQSLIGKETDFLDKSHELVETIINLRNDRGDISHGKFTPKPSDIISTSEFALFVINMTDSILSFMLKVFFDIEIPDTNILDYDSNTMEAYNNWLDESIDFPIKKAKYSQLLYENDYDEYESRYSDEFLKMDELEKPIETKSSKEEEGGAEVEKEKPTEPEAFKKEEVEKPKQKIKRLVNTFDEATFWIEPTIEKVDAFAEEENLKKEELKKRITDYLFSDKKPLRDAVAMTMNKKPALKDRAKTIEILTDKIIALADSLGKPEEKER